MRSFVEIRHRNSGLSCVIDAACNAMYLLPRDSKVSYLSSRFVESARRVSQRLRSHDEGKPEIGDFTSVSHLGLVLQGLGVNCLSGR